MCAGGNNDNWGCFRSARSLYRTERWRAVDSPGVRIMRGVPFASVPHDRRVVPTSNAGNCLIGLAPTIVISERVSISTVDTTRRQSVSDDRGVRRSSHHLRGHMPCETHARLRPTGRHALDQRPWPRRQCQGKAEPALTIMRDDV